MRVGVEASFLLPGKVGGVEFMVKNLVDGLLECDWSVDVVVAAAVEWETARPVTWRSSGYGNRMARAMRAGSLLHDVDIVLATNYVTPLVLGATRPPVVTVLHDVQYVHFPENFSAMKRTWLNQSHRDTLRRAQKVVAISDFVRRDLLRVYGDRWSHKVTTIPNPVSWKRLERRREWHTGTDRPERIVLSVSAQWPHKNVAVLLEAWSLLRSRGLTRGLKLVLVGQRPSGLLGAVRQDDLEPDAEDVLFTGHVPDAELADWYARADLFVFPSLFEGFGLPPVEALGLGIPVLASRSTSIPEVTLGAAHYVDDPRDPEEWASRMTEVLAAPERFAPDPEKVDLIRRRYDPRSIAASYLDLFAGVLAARAVAHA